MLTAEDCAQYAGVEGVYLLAFTRHGAHVPYGTGRYGTAGHYLGWALDIGRRLSEHQHTQGACLTRAVTRASYQLALVRVWPGATRLDERRIKDSHHLARYCPWCQWNLAPIPTPSPTPVSPSLFPVPAPAVVLAS